MKLHSDIKENIPVSRTDAAKGILILMVMFGHAANYIKPEMPVSYLIKYFHVACFLLFPFIYSIPKFDKDFIVKIIVRYFYPFALFSIGYAVLFAGLKGIYPDLMWFVHVVEALIIGTADILDMATGLKALWFLPVLISISCLSAFFIGTLRVHYKWLLLLSFITHATVGMIAYEYKIYGLLGAVNALYLFFIGVFIRYVFMVLSKDQLEKKAYLWLFLFIGFIILSELCGTNIKFPIMNLPTWQTPLSLLIQDGIIVFAFLSLVTLQIHQKSKILQWLGKNSLVLYLTHLPFLAVSVIAAHHFTKDHAPSLQSIYIVLGIMALCLIGSSGIALFLNKMPALKRLIFPREIKDLYFTKRR